MIRILRHMFVMLLILILIIVEGYSQDIPKHTLWRVYVDNDFLNVRGKGTDKAYSGGTRLDVFVEKSGKPLLIPRFLNIPKDSIIFIQQWGVMQMIFTPNNIDNPSFQPSDYFYSAALFLNHSAHVYNRRRSYSFQAEIQAGVRGPMALGKEMQTSIHRLINYRLPKGWDNQLKNLAVFNVNLTLEKHLIRASSFLEFIAGTEWRMGTLESGISVYPLFRVGLMKPYFDGYISQFTDGISQRVKKNRIQAYLVVTPEIKWMLNNGLLQVNGFSTKELKKPDTGPYMNRIQVSEPERKLIRHFIYSVAYGAVFSVGKVAISYMQNSSTEMRKNTYNHEYGNLSLFFNL